MVKCLAIGDGFNDVDMMRVSDLSVQISRKGIPGVHADLITDNFISINNLIFNHSLY
jgi:soluble P-type ATPase